MRIVIILLSFLFFCQSKVFGQFVNIPDSNFRQFLSQQTPGAMLGNMLDTTHSQVINLTYLNCDSLLIKDIDGIQYFDNLTTLICSRNNISNLPTLPPNLVNLNCSGNFLNQLPTLPSTLQSLECSMNGIVQLPILPQGIQKVICSFNNMDTLLPYTPQLMNFDCSFNKIHTLPAFVNSLVVFNCTNNYIATIPTLNSGLLELYTSSNPINSLPSLPNSLFKLHCASNLLTTLPTLPNGLGHLVCKHNNLGNLPTLPLSLIYLDCQDDSLTTLPALPASLEWLVCSANLLTTLPALPTSLTYLDCQTNFIPVLPVLPNGLATLNYSTNPISTLPVLPIGLTNLYWNFNTTTPQLPALPSNLKVLVVNNTPLDSLPSLPNSLLNLSCHNDSLLFLPTLPTGLYYLDCGNNQLTNLPSLPNTIEYLDINNNQITSIASLPTSMQSFYGYSNASLSCLPKLPSIMNYLFINSTAIACLPNLVEVKKGASFGLDTLDLCTPSTGCPVAWNIAGNIHVDTSSNCTLDSLNPGSRVTNLTLRLINNSVTQDTFRVTSMGEYSFDTDDNSTYEVAIDTTNIPFQVTCPPSGSHIVQVTPIDSLKPNISFGISCNGFDAGVRSIFGRFRPATITHLAIAAGDMAQFYNVHCNTTVQPAVVTTTLTGPVSYIQASTNALPPSMVIGNTITYVVPDLSVLDFNTAFNIEVMTDTFAAIGSAVCIKTVISNITNDINLTNNIAEVCFPVVNSYDPNAKYVSPTEKSEPTDLLTYTILFQNTGNDTAYQVIIRDTLDANLDWTTFQFVNASHPINVLQQNDRLTFAFYKINLLDSFNHEPQSHGWLQFKIRLKDHLPKGTKTPNVAAIYFDFNPPIITDTAFNFVGVDTTYITNASPIVVPNAFSPNGDGLNDTWHILNVTYLQRKRIKVDRVQVTNRWGNTVFMDNDDNFRWIPQKDEAAGNYHYFITYTTLSGNKLFQQGEIIIVK